MNPNFRKIENGLDALRANLSLAYEAWHGNREDDALELVRRLAEDAHTLAWQVDAIRDELSRLARQ